MNWDRFAETPPAPLHRWHIDPKLLKPYPNFPQTLPKPYQNPPKILPKSIPNRFQRPLEDNLRPMLLKNSILNGQVTTQRRPKGAKRRPRSSQSPPKLSPRPSQIQFWRNFLAFIFFLKSCIDFSSVFFCFDIISKSSNLRKHCKNLGFFDVFW